jgi:hypothetical protein
LIARQFRQNQYTGYIPSVVSDNAAIFNAGGE